MSCSRCQEAPYRYGFCYPCWYALSKNERSKAYWRWRYRNDPEFRDRVLGHAKASAARRADELAEYQKTWRAANPERAAAYRKQTKARFVERHGCTIGARFRPGRSAVVDTPGGPVEAALASPAYRADGGRWSVDVKLPWGEVVAFPTAQVEVRRWAA